MKTITPTQPKWLRTYRKWSDLSLFEREAFEKCCHLRKSKKGTIYLSTRGRAYYRPKKRTAGVSKDVYVQPVRPAIKKRSLAFRYFIFFLKLLILTATVSIVVGAVVGRIRSQHQTEIISPLPEGSTLETPVYKTSVAEEVQEVAVVENKPQTVEGMIEARFGDKASLALAVAKCESRLKVDEVGDKALNPHAYGIFQIRAFKDRPTISELLVAEKNIDYAFKLSQGGTDWSHWTCYTKGYYLKHL